MEAGGPVSIFESFEALLCAEPQADSEGLASRFQAPHLILLNSEPLALAVGVYHPASHTGWF